MATTKKTPAADGLRGGAVEQGVDQGVEPGDVGPVPLPVPDGGWPPDEFTGKPGSYVRDPYTGKRSPAADAADAAE